MKYVLGIDLGTSGTKTVLFDQYGTAVCSALVEYPLYQPHNGWAEQKPEDWYHAAVDTIRSVLTKSGVDKKDVVSMGISGQMHGLVMLDEAGNVLRPSIIWCDQRTAAECDQIHEIVGRDQLIAITANPALTGFTLSKLLWVRNHEPEVYAKCRHILLPKDYVRYMLTGDFATEVSDASGMQMLDVPNRCWSEKLLNMLNIDPSLLAKVYESCEVTGHISKAAAELTVLSEDTLVVGGAASGKSAYAEHLAVQSGGPRYYLATMQVWDAECAARVAKHRAMRAQKQFATVECPQNLHFVRLPQQGTALLEDLGNLAANELYRPDGSCLPPKQAAEKMLAGIEAIAAQCNHLIIVSNEVFSGGADYAGETDLYLQALAMVNNAVAAKANAVCRVVCGLPVYYKGGERP